MMKLITNFILLVFMNVIIKIIWEHCIYSTYIFTINRINGLIILFNSGLIHLFNDLSYNSMKSLIFGIYYEFLGMYIWKQFYVLA